MKRTFTLIIAILIAISVLGQTVTKSVNESLRKQKSTRTFENQKGIDSKIEKRYLNTNRLKSPKKFKSAQTVWQKLDSLVGEYYDEYSSQWVSGVKIEWEYDAYNNLTAYTLFFVDDITGLFVPDEKEEFMYDNNGNLTQFLYYQYYESISQLVATDKTVTTYDTNGNMEEEIYSYLDDITEEWLFYSKTEYDYINGEMTIASYYYYDELTSQWLINAKIETTYDINGNITENIQYNWNEITSQWVTSVKDEFTYDVDNNMTGYMMYNWDEITSQWVQSISRYEYSYDTNGSMTLEMWFVWDDSNSQWNGFNKYEFTNDAVGNPLQEIYSHWNEATSEWDTISKVEKTFDLSYAFNDLIVPTIDYGYSPCVDYPNMIVNSIYSDFVSDTWVEGAKDTYYYSEKIISSVADNYRSDIKVYPIPATETLTISFGNEFHQLGFELIDVQGTVVMQQMVSNNEQVNVEQLPEGMYFLRLADDNKIVQTEKILIK